MRSQSSSYRRRASRRGFLLQAAAVGAVAQPVSTTGRVRGFDHVALPMQNTAAMIAFYRGLGLDVVEGPTACSVYIGDSMINFHRPSHWQDASFTLRAPAAKPPCGDLCFVWDGTPAALEAMLDRAGAKLIEGPFVRQGGRR